MGEVDTERQALNVARMQLLGAEVIPVKTGSRTLKDAINEALRDWVTNVDNTHYLLGTAAGPHPFPLMVRNFHRIIGIEARAADAGAGRPAARRRRGVRRRRLERDRHLPRRSSTTRTSGWSGCEPGGHGIELRRARRHAVGRHAGRAARRAVVPAAGRGRPDRRGVLDLGRAGLPGRRPGALLPEGLRSRRVPLGHRRRGHGRRSSCCRAPRASSRRSSRRTRSPARSSSAKSSGPDGVILVSLSGRGRQGHGYRGQVLRPGAEEES